MDPHHPPAAVGAVEAPLLGPPGHPHHPRRGRVGPDLAPGPHQEDGQAVHEGEG